MFFNTGHLLDAALLGLVLDPSVFGFNRSALRQDLRNLGLVF
jgi:hypothetical protein